MNQVNTVLYGWKGRYRLLFDHLSQKRAFPRISELDPFAGWAHQGGMLAYGDGLGFNLFNTAGVGYWPLLGGLGATSDVYNDAEAPPSKTVEFSDVDGRLAAIAGSSETGHVVRVNWSGPTNGIGTTFTIGFHVLADALTAGRRLLNTEDDIAASHIRVTCSATGEITYATADASTGFTSVTSTDTISTSSMHSIVIQNDPTDSAKCRLFVDGVEQGTGGFAVHEFNVGRWFDFGIDADAVRNILITDTILSDEDIARFSDVTPPLTLTFVDSLAAETDVSDYVLGLPTDSLITYRMPDLTPGDYTVYATSDNGSTNTMPITIVDFDDFVVTDDYSSDFSDDCATRENWMCANYAYGGEQDGAVYSNGGVSVQNLKLLDGSIVLQAHGDNYTGNVFGVDENGNKAGRKTRVGSEVVSRNYFGFGSFTFTVRFPTEQGVAFSLWLENRQRIYSDDSRYATYAGRGLTERTDSFGTYVEQLHRVGLNWPQKLFYQDPGEDPSACAVELLTSIEDGTSGETRTKYNTEEFLSDGEEHTVTFVWSSTVVEILVDGNPVGSSSANVPFTPMRAHAAIWFPSVTDDYWAGQSAPWVSDGAVLYSFEYVAAADQTGLLNEGETNPI